MGVLDGVRVVELAEHGFVPSCAAVLGDWGADVIKVERPTGDPLRAIMGAGFVADTGDVNHGQGQHGPDVDEGGFDSVSYWSRGGIGHMLTPADGPMVMQRGAMGDAPSGAMLAGGVAAALFQRERTGRGSVVDVSLLNFAVWQLGVDLTATTILRAEPKKAGSDTVRSNPLVGAYRTADDRWLMLGMIDDPRHWAPACRALGFPELIDDPRYLDTAARAANAVSLQARVAEAIASRTLDELRDRLGAEDTIAAVLASPLEVIDDPQVVTNGYLAPHPTHPTARLACAPMQFDDEQIVVHRRAPEIGEHTDEVLAETGFAPDEIAALRSSGALGVPSGAPRAGEPPA